jgi:nucleotide-binding universal stress UspA family protein
VTDALSILVALDLDAHGDTVLEQALRYAKRMNASVDVVHVAPPEPSDFVGYSSGPESVREQVARNLRERHRAVLGMREKITAADVAVGHTLTIQGEISSSIVAEVRRLKPDVLVMGQSHHHRFLQALIKSPTERVLEAIDCVLMIVPTP